MSDTAILLQAIEKLTDRIAQLEDKISPVDSVRMYTCEEFGQLINRRPRWVSERVSMGLIRSLTDKKPFCIPHSELEKALSRRI